MQDENENELTILSLCTPTANREYSEGQGVILSIPTFFSPPFPSLSSFGKEGARMKMLHQRSERPFWQRPARLQLPEQPCFWNKLFCGSFLGPTL